MLQEAALLDGASAVEVLAHVGGFGAVFSGIQCLALELDSLARLNATAGAAGIAELATFAASLFAMYSLVPEVLRRCGAAAFNVGMLSSDVWAFVARASCSSEVSAIYARCSRSWRPSLSFPRDSWCS